MLKNPPKTVLTARVEPELKKQLSEEAAQCDMNLSNYTEYCLRHFNSVLYDHQISEERNEMLKGRISALASESQEILIEKQKLTELNDELESENQALRDKLEFYKERAESLAIQVSD